MGNGLVGARVFANVRGLNHMFAPDVFNDGTDGTRVVIAYLRARMYPKLFSYGGGSAANRQGSLWFAASVLTPHFRLDAMHPARTHRRWLKWLLWLRRDHRTDHNRIITAINRAIDDTPSGAYMPAIEWRWTESTNFYVDITPPDVTTGLQRIVVTSIRGDLSEVDQAVAEEDDDD